MNISEEEKFNKLSKYEGKTSDELLDYLKRRFSAHEQRVDWQDAPQKWILVDDKWIHLNQNKKYLVGKIYSLLGESWNGLGIPIIRRTIKKYIDGIS